MDITVQAPNDSIRKIEDIIDIQKANGNLNTRQVAFSLPTEVEAEAGRWGGGGAAAARSLESALPRRARSRRGRKRGKGRACPLPDAVSWPSDSDITVLRMKACSGGARALADSAGDVAGDGLHRPDGSSMVNLATLVLQSSPASKHSLAAELLLPLTSWERPRPATPAYLPDSRKSRLARFLRLYFCPCCTCLYEMEKDARDEPSVYLTSSRSMDAAENK